jgi:hypothetical protein
MTDEAETWYYAWLPGPWLRIRGPEWPQPLGFDYTGQVLEVECAICGLRLTMSAWQDDPSERMQARVHWEQHVEGEYPVPFFRLPGIGDLKLQSVGTWAEVLLAVPYLLPEGAPIPPIEIMNEILVMGFDDAGMSGGCEWPRHQLSDEEYAALRQDLTNRGHSKLEPPQAVLTRTDYESWKRSVTAPAAYEAYDVLRGLIRTRADEIGSGCAAEELDVVRALFGSLPADYAAYLTDFGWFTVSSHEVIGFGGDLPPHLDVVEVTTWERTQAQPALANHLLPLENNGAGDHYCIDLSVSSAPVVFWSHDHPQGSYQGTPIVAPNFVAWAVRLFAG